MQCQCGGEAVWLSHEVKTLETAREWYPDVQEEDLPIIVNRSLCSCGRQLKRPWSTKEK